MILCHAKGGGYIVFMRAENRQYYRLGTCRRSRSMERRTTPNGRCFDCEGMDFKQGEPVRILNRDLASAVTPKVAQQVENGVAQEPCGFPFGSRQIGQQQPFWRLIAGS